MRERCDIMFDAERMKYPHTGIYHYCKQLGTALIEQQKLHESTLQVYLPRSASTAFPANVQRLYQHSLHKFRMPPQEVGTWHVTYQGTSYFPAAKKTKIALTIHDLNFLYEKELDKQKKYLAILQKKVSRADAIIAISEFVKKEIEQYLIADPKKISVIYNGCNVPSNIITNKPDYEIKYPYIFTLGAITPKKNFHVLPAALVKNELHLVIAGVVQDRKYFAKLLEAARVLGVRDRVHYIGPVFEAEKHWLMEHCALFAFPSIAEGFGLPVIEAMRFGKPVILSTATSLPEIGGKLAYYLEEFDSDEIRRVVEFALSDFSEIKSKETIEWSYKFDWKKSADAYWGVYETLGDR